MACGVGTGFVEWMGVVLVTTGSDEAGVMVMSVKSLFRVG
jgi:hypothetical protein